MPSPAVIDVAIGAVGMVTALQDSVQSTPDQLSPEHMRLLASIYISLVQVLIHEVRYPADDVYQSMSADEKEQFRCYRQDISDTIVSPIFQNVSRVCCIDYSPHSPPLLQMYTNCLLRETLLLLLKNYVVSLSSALPNVAWQDAESLLYVVCNITEDTMFMRGE